MEHSNADETSRKGSDFNYALLYPVLLNKDGISRGSYTIDNRVSTIFGYTYPILV